MIVQAQLLICVKSRVAKVLIGMGIVVAARAQTLEVSTIKPHVTGNACSSPARVLPGGILVACSYTLDLIVREALDLLPGQLTGGPEWVKHDQWDVTAKAEGPVSGSEADVYRGILRAVANERFHLKLRASKRQAKGFVLVVARKGKLGPALIANKDAPHRFDVKPGASLTAQKVTMKEFAAYLKWPLGGGRIVEDKTGLNGEYDFVLRWTPLHAEQIRDKSILTDAPAIFTALREQLGLVARADRVQEDFYTIESAQRPGPN